MAKFRLVKMEDASDPAKITVPKGTKIIAGYIGGDTPHVWTEKNWHSPEFNGLKKLPIFVRSNVVGYTGGVSDAFLALEQLYQLKVPQNTCVVYDRETNLDSLGTQGFGDVMHWAHYYVLPYGSKNNLFSHPALDGYWVADPTGKEHMYNHVGVRLTQYLEENGTDQSAVKFWVYAQRMATW